MSSTRVVVTGVGTVNPLGLTADESWNKAVAGVSGIGPITSYDVTDFYAKVGGEVKGFDAYEYIDPKVADRNPRAVHYGLVAAQEAVGKSGIDMSRECPEKVGVCVAWMSDSGYIVKQASILERRGPRRVDPLFVSRFSASAPAMQIGMAFQARGPNTSVHSLCASGADALGTAMNLIRLGYADVMIAGGTHSYFSPLAMAGFDILGAVTREPDPAKASRPFDAERSGFVFGEGAGMVVLESLEHARARGATILAELAGAGWSFNSFDETTSAASAEAFAMKVAMDRAGVAPHSVEYVNAHGTGTRLNDPTETQAIKLAFGVHAKKLAISSTKSMTGHAMAAAGAIESVVCVMTLATGIIHPTINYRTPDPECDLDYVPNTSREANVNVCLTNSFGFGGENCCLVFKRFGE